MRVALLGPVTAGAFLLAAMSGGCERSPSANEAERSTAVAGTSAQSAPDYNGLWLGLQADGRQAWFVVRDNKLIWLDYEKEIPAGCIYGSEQPLRRVERVEQYVPPQIHQGSISSGTPDVRLVVHFEGPDTARVAYGRGQETMAEASTAANPAGCDYRQSLAVTAKRATPAQVRDSWLSRMDMLLGGVKEMMERPTDGLWTGTTSDGHAIRFLIANNALRWVVAERAPTCALAGQPEDVTKVDAGGHEARVLAGYVDWTKQVAGAGHAAGGEDRFHLAAALGPQGASGRIEHKVSRPAFDWIEACTSDWSSEWTASKVPIGELRGRTDIPARIRFDLGENFVLFESFEFGQVLGGENCDTMQFEPLSAPFVVKGSAFPAYRAHHGPGAGQLIDRMETSLSGPASIGATVSCMGGFVLLKAGGGGAFPPGTYRLEIKVNNGALPGRQQTFTVVE